MAEGLDLDTAVDGLTHKVGPLPAWAWASIAVGGVTAAIVIRRRLSPGTVGEPAEPGADPDDGGALDELVGGGFSGLPGGFVVGGGPSQATGSTTTSTDLNDVTASTVSTISTNSEWSRAAARFLIGRGMQGTIVTDALSRYLSGRRLTSQGSALIDQAVAGIGAPPQPVPPPTVSPTPEPVASPGGGGTAPTPTPTPTPTPVTVAAVSAPAVQVAAPPKVAAPSGQDVGQVRTVSTGSTLYAMFRSVYGSNPSVAQVRAIAAYNGLSVGGPPAYRISPWRVGQVVKFPHQKP